MKKILVPLAALAGRDSYSGLFSSMKPWMAPSYFFTTV